MNTLCKAVPHPFGFPAWVGVKRRVAKKVINARGRNLLRRYHQLSTFKIGDLVCTCDGLNSRVLSVEPVYQYFTWGRVLVDLDLRTDRTGCSLYHCGVTPPISYEAALRYRDEVVQRWTAQGDPWGFGVRYTRMTINPDGTYQP